MTIDELTAADLPQLDLMLDEAFGQDRRRRTAYKLRAGAERLPRFTRAARADGRLIGALQCWPVAFLAAGARVLPLTLLGPVVVAADHRDRGVGSALVRACFAEAGDAPMMLIGDEPYYGRFGFSAERTGGWRLPGPVERERLLARNVDAFPPVGDVMPWRAVQAAA